MTRCLPRAPDRVKVWSPVAGREKSATVCSDMNGSSRDGDILVKNRAKGKRHVCCDLIHTFTRPELRRNDPGRRLEDQSHGLTVRLPPRVLYILDQYYLLAV